MPKYIQYYKLQKYVEGQPVQEFMKGEVVKEDWWPTMGSCEQNDQPTWEIVNNEFICEKDNASNLWNQYQKLQKYVGGEPYLPEEFMKGEIVQSGVEFENQEDCANNVHYVWNATEQYICEPEDANIIYFTTIKEIPSNVHAFYFAFKYLDTDTWSSFEVNKEKRLIDMREYVVYRYVFQVSDESVVAQDKMGQYLVDIDFTGSNMSGINSIRTMFNDCVNLEKVNFGNIDATKVTDTYHCFDNCPKLNELTLPKALYELMINNNDTNADFSKIRINFNDSI